LYRSAAFISGGFGGCPTNPNHRAKTGQKKIVQEKKNLRRIRGSLRTELEYNCTSTPAKAPAVNPLMPGN